MAEAHAHGHVGQAHTDSNHHHGHAHGTQNQRRLGWAFVLTAGFMGIEVAGGWLSGSLALIADAGHMLTDAGALALAWYAARMAARPANARRSYGHDRMTVIAAFVNGLALLVVVGWIAVEAAARLIDPTPVTALPMLAVAVAGLVVNGAVFAILHGAEKSDLNVHGALLHVLGDLLGSIGAIIAAVVIMLTGWTAADPILSLLIVLLIVRGAWRLVRRSGHILMQGVPDGVDEAAVRAALDGEVDGLEDIHHVHAWSLGSAMPVVTLHARLDDEADGDAALAAIKAILARKLRVGHATVQIERGPCADRPASDEATGRRGSPG